jgi:magnesium-transporting ATPase (P-type)
MADRATPHNHLGTTVPTGHLDEKKEYDAPHKDLGEDEEDEDMDALIEELESQDAAIDEEEEEAQPGGARTVPEELLQTSTRDGLTSTEVLQRRKKYGLNQMKEEKENLILKFLGFFVGPIQFVMEVSCTYFETCHLSHAAIGMAKTMLTSTRLLRFSLLVFKTGSTSVLFALCSCSTLASVSSKNTRPVPLSKN